MALGKHCARLSSLNLALARRVTDAGVSALSRGCTSLQALSLAGAVEASAILLLGTGENRAVLTIAGVTKQEHRG